MITEEDDRVMPIKISHDNIDVTRLIRYCEYKLYPSVYFSLHSKLIVEIRLYIKFFSTLIFKKPMEIDHSFFS